MENTVKIELMSGIGIDTRQLPIQHLLTAADSYSVRKLSLVMQ